MSFFSSLFGRSPKPAPKPPAAWTLAKVTHEDGTHGVFRYRQAKPDDWKSVPLSEEISITWPYGGALPDQATSAEMTTFEEVMDDLADTPDTRLVLVMTGQGSREWCYYARNYDAFMRALNKCLAGQPRFPIDIVHSHDPEWKYWDSLMNGLEKS